MGAGQLWGKVEETQLERNAFMIENILQWTGGVSTEPETVGFNKFVELVCVF